LCSIGCLSLPSWRHVLFGADLCSMLMLKRKQDLRGREHPPSTREFAFCFSNIWDGGVVAPGCSSLVSSNHDARRSCCRTMLMIGGSQVPGRANTPSDRQIRAPFRPPYGTSTSSRHAQEKPDLGAREHPPSDRNSWAFPATYATSASPRHDVRRWCRRTIMPVVRVVAAC
jgi:hypothetical protein